LTERGKIINLEEKRKKARTVWDGKRLRLEKSIQDKDKVGEFERDWRLKHKRRRNVIIIVAVILVVFFLLRVVALPLNWF